MAQSEPDKTDATDKNDVKKRLQEIDVSLREKYMEIIQSLSLDELKCFNKYNYKEMVKSDIVELLPEADDKVIDGSAHYISNTLNNEAQRQRTIKSKKPNTRRTRQSAELEDIEPHRQHTETNKQDKNNVTSSQETDSLHSDLSETVMNAFDSTMLDPNDTLNSTTTASYMDDTYETINNLDDSVTELKSIGQENHKPTKKKKQCKSNNQSNQATATEKEDASDCEIICTDQCSNDSNSASIRCNLCMVWFHSNCVGISDIDVVGAWVCASCRLLPKTVTTMKLQMETLLDTTMKIFDTFTSFSIKMENKFENLNDRLTVVSNQNKCLDQASTSSLSDIRQDINTLKTEMDRKTNVILSKSQGIFDKVKTATDLISNSQDNAPGKKTSEKSTANQVNHDQTNCKTNVRDSCPKPNSIINAENRINAAGTSKHKSDPQTDQVKEKPKNPDLTFITGSCILKSIETKFLGENVRVKSFKKAKIENLQEALSKMDLSRYKSIVLHIGGHDVDAKISQNSFKEKYQSLLNSLTQRDCNIYVSGLLPRGGTNMKPFNGILKDLCKTINAVFIENHDSFILASGELPFDFFHADKVNLKYLGTRALVHNINDHCQILPVQTKAHSSTNFVRNFNQPPRRFTGHNFRGNRLNPIYIR